ncbi:MAG TPA: DUF3301 domain-containing protein [Gammaproteobacteria bacterium]|nr:DUF3301 domain-containing protein [Gammaproteobacteria bacterium]
MGIILIILAAVAIGWLWNDTLVTRERVLRRCRRALDELNLQLLDETVAVRRVSLRRNRRGHIAIARSYQFEFSTDGRDRWPGRAVLLGHVLETLQIETAEGVTIEPSEHYH